MEGVRHVRIRSYRTSFWRFHTKGVPSDGLCTVEAVYFLCKEARGRASAAALRAPHYAAPLRRALEICNCHCPRRRVWRSADSSSLCATFCAIGWSNSCTRARASTPIATASMTFYGISLSCIGRSTENPEGDCSMSGRPVR